VRELLSVLVEPPLKNVIPDVIIAHDHVTGREALRIKEHIYKSSKCFHIIHAIPTESEQYKCHPHPVGASMYGYDKRVRQDELCSKADLVIAVGPKILTTLSQQLK
jgi:hypothetical protein